VSKAIDNLEPQLVWKYFYEISQIPRCSGSEKAVGEYIISIAEKFNLPWKKDQTGNILVSKKAAKGMENRPGVVIQGHIDMVCEKNDDTIHDFSKDPIKLIRDGDWITADGTTLGADNGIETAIALALMEADDIAHPPLEFLFTVDEETGLTGANELKEDFLEGRILLNIDSEEEGALYIGCAGGKETVLKKKIKWNSAPNNAAALNIKIGGLRGGHSGLNIHEGFGNAVKLLARLLYRLNCDYEMGLVSISGGSKHNAIPREANADIVFPENKISDLKRIIEEYEQKYKEELKFTDPGVKITFTETDKFKSVMSPEIRDQLIRALYVMPHGVVEMSHAIEGLVETSTNMAIISTVGNQIEILTSQRSSIESAVEDIADKVKALGELSGFIVEQGGGYPAWTPNPDSALLKSCREIYRNKYGSEPEVKAIHAGLECGIIGEHYDGMDMISFGPDIEGAHSPDERLRIESVAHIWEFLLEILKKIS
jgi:dipeptidase D